MRYSTRLKLFRLGLALIYGLIYGITYSTFRNIWEFLNNEEMKDAIREANKRERDSVINAMEAFINEAR